MGPTRNILITGANGFIGTSLVEEAIRRGYHVYAAVRKTSDVRSLADKEVEIVFFDYTDPIGILKTLSRLPVIDYVIHNAGLTKSISRKEFSLVNFIYTKNLMLALSEPSVKPEKFVFISSIAAQGPKSVKQSDNPLTLYGKSKLLAEDFIKEYQTLNYIIIRPTAVYGPGDRDFLKSVKIINRGFDLQIGSGKRKLSFIYVKDLARLVIDATESSYSNKSYYASDGYLYDHRAFGRYVSEALNRKIMSIRVPLYLVKFVALCGDFFVTLSGKSSIINSDKIKDLSASDWSCDIDAAKTDLGFEAHFDLKMGISETVAWYREKGWL